MGYLEPPEDGTLVRSPIGGRECVKTPELRRAVVEAKTYYFCDESEWRRFIGDPGRYRDSP